MEPIVSGIGVLDKAIALVQLLESGPQSLAELVSASGYSRATTHRLLRSLVDHQVVRRDQQGRYDLGWRLVGWGRTAEQRWDLAVEARPVLEALRTRSGESVQLYVRDGDERVCVVAFDSPDELRTVVPPGARLPLNRGSAGAALRGEAGPNGWVASVAERAAGVASVSAPVLMPDGRIVAALGVSGPTERLTNDPGVLHGADVVAAATELARRISAVAGV